MGGDSSKMGRKPPQIFWNRESKGGMPLFSSSDEKNGIRAIPPVLLDPEVKNSRRTQNNVCD
jgi:hypothetical protein